MDYDHEILTRLNKVRDAICMCGVSMKRNDVWYVSMPVSQREDLALELLQIISAIERQ